MGRCCNAAGSRIALRALCARWELAQRIDDRDIQRHEMALIAGENCQGMPAGRRRNGDIGKSRGMTPTTRQIGQCTGDFRCCAIERQHAISV